MWKKYPDFNIRFFFLSFLLTSIWNIFKNNLLRTGDFVGALLSKSTVLC